MLSLENLLALPPEQLRIEAEKQGLKPHHKAKPETIAKQLMDKITNPPKAEEMKHPAEKKTEPAKVNTQEEVRKACEKIFQKEGYEVEFKGETWRFKYKGAEDSGHMSVPLRVIKMKAESVGHGARKPRFLAYSAQDGMPVYSA